MLNLVQQVHSRMANPASNETKKSGNVQKALTSHSSQTQRWQASNTQSHTRTREHLHGDRFGTTSSMGLGGTPTVYQDWSYTDKLHLTMRHSKPHTITINIVVLWPPAKISELGTWTKEQMAKSEIWPTPGAFFFPLYFLPLLFHKAPQFPVLVIRFISWFGRKIPKSMKFSPRDSLHFTVRAIQLANQNRK